jgi:acyl transferase domain-containing protein
MSSCANRASFVFGLTGPSIVVDTACSSSLVALHVARQSLRDGECDVAVVASADLVLSPFSLQVLPLPLRLSALFRR